MKYFKNLPEIPTPLSKLIDVRKNQVVSMALSKKEDTQMILFAFSAGEGVSEEAYPSDTLYLVVEGNMSIKLDNNSYQLKSGECMAIPAEKLHSFCGNSDFKLLQINLC
ncbi:MAG: cupin domain-containing protein [Candidatus Pseudoruminococcus sp.]|uniref:cupin domain-containing protein n=1 Tax=Candidatus Pseudoruminococcus sp. TaxID=3101048 RepID=UPI002A76DF9F|nr:cupin domain-containing protein [Ruminococcus sp.]MDY2783782.1 cupin domain-containing protein [Candidatus Pseudoruminococcus sp.]